MSSSLIKWDTDLQAEFLASNDNKGDLYAVMFVWIHGHMLKYWKYWLVSLQLDVLIILV